MLDLDVLQVAVLMLQVSAAMPAHTKAALTMNTHGIVVRTWNDAPISRRDSDGYADATAMCQANGKLWGNYRQLDRTTEYIAALADATGLQPAQLVITTSTGPNHLRGTWIHPRLAVDLARWISPAFAVWMDGWFLDAVSTPQQLKPRRRTAWASLSPISAERLEAVIPWCDPLTSAQILDWLDLPYTRGNQMALSTAMRALGYTKHRVTVDGRQHWVYRTHDPVHAAPTLPEGVHIVAPTRRRAAEIWWRTVRGELCSAIDQSINPTARTDYGLPVTASYTWHSAA